MNADFREEWYSCTAHKKRKKKKKMELSWCNHDACYEAIREKVVGDRNSVELTGPATGQVVYSWEVEENEDEEEHDTTTMIPNPPAVLMLVKRDEDELLKVAAKTIEQLMEMGVQVLVDSMLMEELASFETIDLDSKLIRLFYPRPVPGFGSGEQLFDSVTCNASTDNNSCALSLVKEKMKEKSKQYFWRVWPMLT